MLADFLALLDKPLLLLIVMAIGGAIGIGIESAFNRIDRERRKAYWRGRNAARGKPRNRRKRKCPDPAWFAACG